MKKILIVAASALCAVAVYVGVNAYNNNSQMDLLTQNVEALTRGETDPVEYAYMGYCNSPWVMEICCTSTYHPDLC